MHARLLSLTLLAILPMAALAAACGGDDDYQAPPLLLAGYVGAADPICAKAQQEIDALQGSLTGTLPSSLPDADWARYYQAAAKVGESALVQLRELNPQESDAARIEAALSVLDELVQHTKQLGDAVGGSDPQEFARLAGQPAPSREPLLALGLDDCAKLRFGPAGALPSLSP